MKLEKRLWGALPQGDVHLYTLEGGAGVRAEISDLGATVQSLFVPDRNGVPADVVLGYDTPEEYLANGCFSARRSGATPTGSRARASVSRTTPTA